MPTNDDWIRAQPDQSDDDWIESYPSSPVAADQQPTLAKQPEKTWRDAFADIKRHPLRYVPFLNILDTVNDFKTMGAARRIRKGTATDQDMQRVQSAMLDAQREGSFGYKAWSVAFNAVPYAIEFSYGTKAIKALANKGLKTGAKLGQKSLMTKISQYYADDVLEGGIKSLTRKKVGQLTRKAAAEAPIRALMTPGITARSLAQRMTPRGAMTENELGELEMVLMDDGDDFLPALTKAYADSTVEAFTEQLGEHMTFLGQVAGRKLGIAAKKAAVLKKVAPYLGGLPNVVKRLRGKGLGEYAQGLGKSLGWHGILGELYEERIGDVLRSTTGLQPLNQMFPSIEDLAAEATGFALMPLINGAVALQAVRDPVTQEEADENKKLFNAVASPKDGVNTVRERSTNLKALNERLVSERSEPMLHQFRLFNKLIGDTRPGTMKSIVDSLGFEEVRAEHKAATEGLSEKEALKEGAKVLDKFFRSKRIAPKTVANQTEKQQWIAETTGEDPNIYSPGRMLFNRKTGEQIYYTDNPQLAKDLGVDLVVDAKRSVDMLDIAEEIDIGTLDKMLENNEPKVKELKKFQELFYLETIEEAKEQYDFLRGILADERFSADEGSVRTFVSAPFWLRGTREEIVAVSGYLSPNAKPSRRGKTEAENIYTVMVNATNDADGKRLLFTRNARQWDIVEDVTETLAKRAYGSVDALTASPEFDRWDKWAIGKIQDELQAEEDPERAKWLRYMLEMNEFERWSKMVTHSRFGQAVGDNSFNAALDIFTQIPENIMAEQDTVLELMMGKRLMKHLAQGYKPKTLEAVELEEEAPAEESPAMDAAAEAMTRKKGTLAKARKEVAKAAEEGFAPAEAVAALSEVLDRRTDDSGRRKGPLSNDEIEAIGKVLTDLKDAGVSFSLQSAEDAIPAEEKKVVILGAAEDAAGDSDVFLMHRMGRDANSILFATDVDDGGDNNDTVLLEQRIRADGGSDWVIINRALEMADKFSTPRNPLSITGLPTHADRVAMMEYYRGLLSASRELIDNPGSFLDRQRDAEKRRSREAIAELDAADRLKESYRLYDFTWSNINKNYQPERFAEVAEIFIPKSGVPRRKGEEKDERGFRIRDFAPYPVIFETIYSEEEFREVMPHWLSDPFGGEKLAAVRERWMENFGRDTQRLDDVVMDAMAALGAAIPRATTEVGPARRRSTWEDIQLGAEYAYMKMLETPGQQYQAAVDRLNEARRIDAPASEINKLEWAVTYRKRDYDYHQRLTPELMLHKFLEELLWAQSKIRGNKAVEFTSTRKVWIGDKQMPATNAVPGDPLSQEPAIATEPGEIPIDAEMGAEEYLESSNLSVDEISPGGVVMMYRKALAETISSLTREQVGGALHSANLSNALSAEFDPRRMVDLKPVTSSYIDQFGRVIDWSIREQLDALYPAHSFYMREMLMREVNDPEGGTRAAGLIPETIIDAGLEVDTSTQAVRVRHPSVQGWRELSALTRPHVPVVKEDYRIAMTYDLNPSQSASGEQVDEIELITKGKKRAFVRSFEQRPKKGDVMVVSYYNRFNKETGEREDVEQAIEVEKVRSMAEAKEVLGKEWLAQIAIAEKISDKEAAARAKRGHYADSNYEVTFRLSDRLDPPQLAKGFSGQMLLAPLYALAADRKMFDVNGAIVVWDPAEDLKQGYPMLRFVQAMVTNMFPGAQAAQRKMERKTTLEGEELETPEEEVQLDLSGVLSEIQLPNETGAIDFHTYHKGEYTPQVYNGSVYIILADDLRAITSDAPTMENQTAKHRLAQELRSWFIRNQVSRLAVAGTDVMDDANKTLVKPDWMDTFDVVLRETLSMGDKDPVRKRGRVEEAAARREQRKLEAAAKPKSLGSYRGIPLVKSEGTTRGAHYNREAGVIELNMDKLSSSFEAKQWTAPRVEGVTPLAEDTFKTFDHWYRFVLEHERQHALRGVRPADIPLALWENNMTELALENVPPATAYDAVSGEQRLFETEQAALLAEQEARETGTPGPKEWIRVTYDIPKDRQFPTGQVKKNVSMERVTTMVPKEQFHDYERGLLTVANADGTPVWVQVESKVPMDTTAEAPAPTPVPTEPPSRREPMSFPMRANENITGEATTTMDLVIEGVRTATTRHWKPLPEVGERIQFHDRKGQTANVVVDGVENVGDAIAAGPSQDAALERLALPEAWTAEAFKEHYAKGRTVNDSAHQVRFHLEKPITFGEELVSPASPPSFSLAAPEFPAPFMKNGTVVDVDTGQGICDYTAARCRDWLSKAGYTGTAVAELKAKSPVPGVGKITHRVAIGTDGAGNEWILDQPQTEFIQVSDQPAWESGASLISNAMGGPWRRFRDHIASIGLSPEMAFVSKDEALKMGEWEDWEMMGVTSMAGAVKNVERRTALSPEEHVVARAMAEKDVEYYGLTDPAAIENAINEYVERISPSETYPIYEGELDGVRVRYNTNTEELQFLNEAPVRWTQDLFTPRFMDMRPGESVSKAYNRNLKTPTDNVPIFPAEAPTADERIQPSLEPLPNESPSASLALAEDFLDTTMPHLTASTPALKELWIQRGRMMKLAILKAEGFLYDFKVRTGYYSSDPEVAERARQLNEAITAQLEYERRGEEKGAAPARIPRSTKSTDMPMPGYPGRYLHDVEADDAQPFYDAYDAGRPGGSPTAQEAQDEMRQFYNELYAHYDDMINNMSDAEWIRYLDDYVNHIFRRSEAMTEEELAAIKNSVKERAREVEKRKIPTYYEAAQIGLLPVDMDITYLANRYARDLARTAHNKILFNNAVLVREAAGMGTWIPRMRVTPTPGKQPIIEDSSLHQAGEMLANAAGRKWDKTRSPGPQLNELLEDFAAGKIRMVDPNEADSPVDRNGKPVERVMTLEDLGYEYMPAPTMSQVDGFWVRKGPAQNVLRGMIDMPWDNKWLKKIESFNQITKSAQLLFSPFHPFSLIESYIASHGLNWKNPGLQPWNWGKEWMKITQTAKDLLAHPELLYPWAEHGLHFNRKDPNIDTQQVDKWLRQGVEQLEGSDKYWKKSLAPAARRFFKTKKQWDDWLWNNFHPAIKYLVAENMLAESKRAAAEAGREWDEDVAREWIAASVNKQFGGIEFEQMLWATPHAKQMMHLLLFAPDWTIAAASIAGATTLPGIRRAFQQPGYTERQFMTKMYWPAFAAIVLFAIPNAMQFLMWMVAGGDDDEPFTFLNEEGKRTHIDFTPVLRHLDWVPGVGYEGGDSGKRRVYLRWGKQAYEVFEGWYGKTAKTLLNKTSTSVRTAFEIATGSTFGGWRLPFKDSGFAGTLIANGKFTESRAAHVAQKFLPLSLVQMAKGQPVGVFAPASRGASQGTLLREMQQVLDAYANPTLWRKLSGRPKYMAKLETLMPHLFQKGWQNGVNPHDAFKRAVSYARAKYYRQFFKALNAGQDGAMEQAAEAIIRLQGKVENVLSSIERRAKAYDRALDPAELAEIEMLVREKFDEARE